MNKKEVLEIRKQFSPKNCAITKICGCYVDYEKNKKMESKDAFLALPEEEAFKYFDIFKKTLSRSISSSRRLSRSFNRNSCVPPGISASSGNSIFSIFFPMILRWMMLQMKYISIY